MKAVPFLTKRPDTVRLVGAIGGSEQPVIPALANHHEIFFTISQQRIGLAYSRVLPLFDIGMNNSTLN